MAEVTLKQGDTTPEFTAALDGAAQELSGDESIRFYMEAEPGQTGGPGDLLVNQPVSSIDRNTAPPTVTYDFGPGETSRLGTHLAEIVVTYVDGEVQSFPASGYFQIEIGEPTNRDVPPEDLDLPDITVGVVEADAVSGSVAGGTAITNFSGNGLEINPEGALSTTATTGVTLSKAAAGSTTLTNGNAVVDTGVAPDGSPFDVWLSPVDCDAAASLDTRDRHIKIHIEENSSAVGDPVVGWTLVKGDLP